MGSGGVGDTEFVAKDLMPFIIIESIHEKLRAKL